MYCDQIKIILERNFHARELILCSMYIIVTIKLNESRLKYFNYHNRMIYLITCLHKPCKLTRNNFFCPSTLDVSIIWSIRICVLLRVIAVGAIINCNINRFRLEGKHRICGFLGKLTCPHDTADWPTLQYNDNDNNRQQQFIQLKNLMRSKLLTQASISCKNTQCLFGYVNRFASY